MRTSFFFFFFFLVIHDEGLTRRELLVQDGETLFTLLRCFNGDEVLDLMRKNDAAGERDGMGGREDGEKGGGRIKIKY